MKIPQTFSAITAIALISANFAHAEEYVDYARVISTTPVVEKIYAPSSDCRHSAYSKPASADPAVVMLGALLGGVAGAQAGRGTGKDAASAAGALVGAKIASGGGEVTGEEILGALAGGIIGNQVGGGSGKTAATATGAVLGSAIASGMVSRTPETFARECGSRVVSRNVITKHKVNFEYNGVMFESELPYMPEGEVSVLVDVQLIEDKTL